MSEYRSLISIIIAVYNSEEYLGRCFDSIIAQTYTRWEAIVVDDGSTDHSLEICREYAKKDSRFRVYHKDNGGVSSARQYGIDRLSDGSVYSIHVDPDDWVDPMMLESLYNKAMESEADMVICDFFYNLPVREIYIDQNPKSEQPKQVLGVLFQGLHGSLCNKLIRSDSYNKFGIRFPVGLDYCEDLFVNIALLQRIDNVAYLPQAFYHYDQYSNPNPATRNECSSRIDFTRTEVVKRTRLIVKEELKNWQYYLFEAHNAFSILDGGSMSMKAFREFFHDIPMSVLLHRHTGYVRTFLTCLVVHLHFSRDLVIRSYNNYLAFRQMVINTKQSVL
ncbi:MAG: glycosyltransferase family 2 protein [Bacteroidaceae bacterium]|nr:glycosyltransferase family 2 protein [Bacteroidaceae bacterium]